MSNVIEDFFVALGFQIDSQDLDAFQEQVEQANTTLATLGAATVATAGSIFAFVSEVTGGIDDLADFAAVNIESIEALQELGFAAQANGSSLDAVKNSVASLNGTIGEAALGIGKGAAIFEKLGLSAKDSNGQVKSASALLEEVADRFVGLSREEKIALAEKLGIDSSLIPLLSQGRDAVAALRSEARELGVVTQEEADISGQLGDAMDRLEFLALSLSRTIAVALTPAIAETVTSVKEFILRNKEAINTGVTTFVKVLTTVLGVLWAIVYRAGQAFTFLAKTLLDNKVVLYALGAAAAGFVALNLGRSIIGLAAAFRTAATATWSFSLPLIAIPLLIGAIAIAIGLLVDDFLTFKEGGESVIGDLVNAFPALGAIIKSVEDAFAVFSNFWLQQGEELSGSLGELLGALGRLAATLLEVIWPIVATVFKGWLELAGLVIPPLASIAAFLIDGVAGALNYVIGLVTSFLDKIQGAASFVADLLSFGDKNVNVETTQKVTGGGGVPVLTGAGVLANTAANSSNSSIVNNAINAPINILSPDPTKAGESVRKELEAVNKQVIRNSKSSVGL